MPSRNSQFNFPWKSESISCSWVTWFPSKNKEILSHAPKSCDVVWSSHPGTKKLRKIQPCDLGQKRAGKRRIHLIMWPLNYESVLYQRKICHVTRLVILSFLGALLVLTELKAFGRPQWTCGEPNKLCRATTWLNKSLFFWNDHKGVWLWEIKILAACESRLVCSNTLQTVSTLLDTLLYIMITSR